MNLTTLEIQDLINRYRSELSKLHFQVDSINSIVSNLEAQLKDQQKSRTKDTAVSAPKTSAPAKKKEKKKEAAIAAKEEPKKDVKVETGSSNGTETKKASKRGRPAKKKKPGRKPGRKPGSKARKSKSSPKGYKLSDFDKFVMNSLKSSGHVLTNADFLELSHKNNIDEKLGLSDDQIKAKLNRSLFKLANRRDELAKIDYPGKGYAYALKKWLDEYDNLKLRYQRSFEEA